MLSLHSAKQDAGRLSRNRLALEIVELPEIVERTNIDSERTPPVTIDDVWIVFATPVRCIAGPTLNCLPKLVTASDCPTVDVKTLPAGVTLLRRTVHVRID
jgi:hypothetical protein